MYSGEGEIPDRGPQSGGESEQEPALSPGGRAQSACGRGHRGRLLRGVHHGRQHPQALQGQGVPHHVQLITVYKDPFGISKN